MTVYFGHREIPVLTSGARWDGAKCSDMTIFKLPNVDGTLLLYRMFYEGCDGTSDGKRGIWRFSKTW